MYVYMSKETQISEKRPIKKTKKRDLQPFEEGLVKNFYPLMKDCKADFWRIFLGIFPGKFLALSNSQIRWIQTKIIWIVSFTVLIYWNMPIDWMSTRDAADSKWKSQRTSSKSQKSTKSRTSNSSVQIQINSKTQFEFVPRDTEKLSLSIW